MQNQTKLQEIMERKQKAVDIKSAARKYLASVRAREIIRGAIIKVRA